MSSFKEIEDKKAIVDAVLSLSPVVAVFAIVMLSIYVRIEELQYVLLIVLASYGVLQFITYHTGFKSYEKSEQKNHAEYILKQLWLIEATRWFSRVFVIFLIIASIILTIMLGVLIDNHSSFMKTYDIHEEQKFKINQMDLPQLQTHLKQKYNDFNFNHTSGLTSLYELKLQKYNVENDENASYPLEDIQKIIQQLTPNQKYDVLIAETARLDQNELRELINVEMNKSIPPYPNNHVIIGDIFLIFIMITGVLGITFTFSAIYSRFVGLDGRFKISRETFALIQTFEDMKPLDKKRYIVLGMHHYNQFLRKKLKLYIKNMEIAISEIVSWNSQECDKNALKFVKALDGNDQLELIKTWKETLNKTMIVDTWMWQKTLKIYLKYIIPGTVTTSIGILITYLLSIYNVQ